LSKLKIRTGVIQTSINDHSSTFISIITDDDNEQLTKTINISSSTFINYNLVNNLIRNKNWSESLNKFNVNITQDIFNDEINEFIKSL